MGRTADDQGRFQAISATVADNSACRNEASRGTTSISIDYEGVQDRSRLWRGKWHSRKGRTTVTQIPSAFQIQTRFVLVQPPHRCSSDLRADVLRRDFTRGVNSKAVSVANKVDAELPPGLKLEDLHEDVRVMKRWRPSTDPFEFGVKMRLHHNVPEPTVPHEITEASSEDPHKYLMKLNHG